MIFIYAAMSLIYVTASMYDEMSGRLISKLTWAILFIFAVRKWHFIVCLIIQMKKLLGIRVFHINCPDR